MIGAEARMFVRVDPELREKFFAVCERHRVGVSAVLRAAMQIVVESGELPEPADEKYKVQSQLELFEQHPNTTPITFK